MQTSKISSRDAKKRAEFDAPAGCEPSTFVTASVGATCRSSWGNDQNSIDSYGVGKVTARTLEFRLVAQRRIAVTSDMSEPHRYLVSAPA